MHPGQVSILGPSKGVLGQYELYRPNGQLYSKHTMNWSTSNYGLFDWAERSASVSNPPDGDGWRMPSPYYGKKDSGKITSYDIVGAVKNDGVNWWPIRIYDAIVSNNEVGPTYTPTLPWNVSTLQSAARQKALLKFKDKRVDLSVAWAERKKTANLVCDSIEALLSLKKDLMRKHSLSSGWEHSKKLAKDFSSIWLAYRYAWTPTLLDVHGAAVAVAKQDAGTYKRYKVTARAKDVRESDVTTAVDSSVTCGYTMPTIQSKRERYKLEVKVRYDAFLENKLYRGLQDVGVTDPLTTAWELLPYSFVVDWFLGIGDFLDGVNALSGYSFQAGCETIYQEYGVEVHHMPRTSGVWRTDSITGGATRERKSFNRSVLPAPTSQLLFKQQPLNLTRMFDSIALLAGAFGGKSKRASFR